MAGRETRRIEDFTKVLQITPTLPGVIGSWEVQRVQRGRPGGGAPGKTPVLQPSARMFEFLFADAVFFHELVKLAGGNGRFRGGLVDAPVVSAEQLFDVAPFDLRNADPADLGQVLRRVDLDVG
jgi:hypothetical protein